MDEKGYEFYRQEGKGFRSLRVDCDGTGLRISGQDLGEYVRQFFGKDEYEFWVDVPREAVADLAMALIRHHYAGREKAVDEIRDLCEKYGVEHKFQTW